MESHSEKVQKIAAQVSGALRNKRKVRVFHGFTHSTRELSFEGVEPVDISSLNHVLEINTAEKYALVEPDVTMGALVEETLKKGLVPLVVPEFPRITVGGAIQGGAGESSSFKYGGVHSICEEYEVILGNGEIVKASISDNPDLFWGMPCSYGSLGITTLAKIRLIDAKPFVRLTYLPEKSFAELLNTIQAHIRTDAEFIDAVAFGPTSSVAMVGHMVDSPTSEANTVTFLGKSDEWFYLHVQKKLGSKNLSDDFIPIKDYLFRYNRGGFWAGKYVFDELKIPFTKFTRALMDKYLDAKGLGKALHKTNRSQSVICQDFCLPHNKVLEFLNYLDVTLGDYPLWVVPLKPTKEGDKLSPVHLPTESVINVGVYTRFRGSYEDFLKVNRDLEKKLSELGGRKVLYAHQYFAPGEFWRMYDREWYQQLREKYFASDVFPDIYTSTHVGRKYETKSFKAILSFLRELV